jgi:glycosyltransferase involved in cell wall biosynthesis
MRIALVVPGGVDRSAEYRVIPAVLALIQRLSLDNDVQVIALHQEPCAAEWDLLGARVHNIGLPRAGLRAIYTIFKLHRAAPFDIVQAIFSGTSGLVALLAGRLLKISSAVHIGGGELMSIPDIAYGGAQTVRGRLREAIVLRRVSAVTAASAATIQTLSQIGVAAQRIALGVDLNSWPPRSPVGRNPDKPARLIHVASLNRVKDQATLLKALALLLKAGCHFEMDIIGEDTLRGEIQELTQRMQLSQLVRFHGFLPQRLLRPLVEAAHLMIHTSRHETGPLAVLEAAVAGVPTVGTAVGHVAEWAPDAAISVPVGRSDLLAAAIQQLLDDEARRIRIAREALVRATIEDADYTAREFRTLYSRLTPHNRSAHRC